MVYVLIVILTMTHNSFAVTQEFNTKEACVSAQKEILRQQATNRVSYQPSAIFCAAKGEKN